MSPNQRMSATKRQTKQDGNVTVRDRNDASQIRIDKSHCVEYLQEKLHL